MEEATATMTDAEKIKECLQTSTDVVKLDKKFTSRKYWRVTRPSEKLNLGHMRAVTDAFDKVSITLSTSGLLIIQNTGNKRKRSDEVKKKYKELPSHYDLLENEIARNILLEFINHNNYLCKLEVAVTSGHTLVIEPKESIQLKNIVKVHNSIDKNAAWEFTWNKGLKIRIKFL